MKFGKMIWQWRGLNNLGLRELARAAKISPAYLSRLESGKEKPPSVAVLEKLAEALGFNDETRLMMFAAADQCPPEILQAFKQDPVVVGSFFQNFKITAKGEADAD